MTKRKELVQLPDEVMHPLEQNPQDNTEWLYNMKEFRSTVTWEERAETCWSGCQK